MTELPSRVGQFLFNQPTNQKSSQHRIWQTRFQKAVKVKDDEQKNLQRSQSYVSIT